MTETTSKKGTGNMAGTAPKNGAGNMPETTPEKEVRNAPETALENEGGNRAKPSPEKDEKTAGNPQLRAAIYARLSSDDRRNGTPSLSVQSQVEECARLAEGKGYKIISDPLTGNPCFIDDGISGRTWPDGPQYDLLANADTLTVQYVANMLHQRRPGLGRLFDLVLAGKVDVICCADKTRLARPVARSTYQSWTPNTLIAHQCSLLAGGELFDFKDPVRLALSIFQESILDAEIRHRADKAKAATLREKERGRYMSGQLPYGLARRGGRIAADERTVGVLRRLFAAVAGGKTLGGELRKLNDEDVPTANGGALWDINTARHMLANPLYIGKMRAGGRLVACTDMDGPVIDECLFYAVQTLQESRKRAQVANGAASRGCLATGIVWCQCGRRLVVLPSTAGASYRCSSRLVGRCGTAIRAAVLNDFLEPFLAAARLMEFDRIQAAQERRRELPALRKEEVDINERIRLVNEAILNREISVAHVLDMLKIAKDRLSELQRTIAMLEALPESAQAHCERVMDTSAWDLDRKREAIRTVFQRVAVHADKVDFTLTTGERFTVKRNRRSGNRLGRWLPAPPKAVAPKNGEGLQFMVDADALGKESVFMCGRLKLTPVPQNHHEASTRHFPKKSLKPSAAKAQKANGKS